MCVCAKGFDVLYSNSLQPVDSRLQLTNDLKENRNEEFSIYLHQFLFVICFILIYRLCQQLLVS